MRVLVLGNSGSGKSHYARALAAGNGLAHLDLDTIVWERGKIAVARAAGDVARDLRAFIDGKERWVVEGCYGDVIEAALADCSELVFMNPGKEVCLENNRKRPWEAHKYASPEAQLSMLPFLLDWVGVYYSRDDSCSYVTHRRIFDGFSGSKREILQQ